MKSLMIGVVGAVVVLCGCAGNQSALDKANDKIHALEKRVSDDDSYTVTCKDAVQKIHEWSDKVREQASAAEDKVVQSVKDSYNTEKPIVEEKVRNAYDKATEWAKKEVDSSLK